MLDIKTWDPERHKRLTGMDVGPTLEFARRLRRPQAADVDPLRPGAGADRRSRGHREDRPVSRASLGNVERVDVLPFHQMGRYKWHQLKMNYTLENVEPPNAELIEQACGVFRAAGLKTY